MPIIEPYYYEAKQIVRTKWKTKREAEMPLALLSGEYVFAMHAQSEPLRRAKGEKEKEEKRRKKMVVLIRIYFVWSQNTKIIHKHTQLIIMLNVDADADDDDDDRLAIVDCGRPDGKYISFSAPVCSSSAHKYQQDEKYRSIRRSKSCATTTMSMITYRNYTRIDFI